MSRPRPVLTSASIAAGITGLAAVLGFLGFTDAETSLGAEATAIGSVVVAAIAVGSHLLAALHAQGKVTPVHDARADDGVPLVRSDSVAAGFDSRPDLPHPELKLAADQHPDESLIVFDDPGAHAAD